jgi:hypothetical protein
VRGARIDAGLIQAANGAMKGGGMDATQLLKQLSDRPLRVVIAAQELPKNGALGGLLAV